MRENEHYLNKALINFNLQQIIKISIIYDKFSLLIK
jgi:hypothetical protein